MKIFKKSIVALLFMTTPSATVGQTCRVDTLLQYMHDKGKSKHVMIFAHRGNCTARTAPTLLYDVPNEHLQRLSAHKCVAARGGTCGICSPSIAYGAQHSPCYAGVCVYTLKQLLGRG